jgi:hypothetical protein
MAILPETQHTRFVGRLPLLDGAAGTGGRRRTSLTEKNRGPAQARCTASWPVRRACTQTNFAAMKRVNIKILW